MSGTVNTAEAGQWVTEELPDNPYYTQMHYIPDSGLSVCEVRDNGVKVSVQKGDFYHTATLYEGYLRREKHYKQGDKGWWSTTPIGRREDLITPRADDLVRLPESITRHFGNLFTSDMPTSRG